MTSNYQMMEDLFGKAAHTLAAAMEYDAASLLSSLENKPTKYQGIGRPRSTDYAIYKHPFDGKLTKSINY